MTSLIQINAIHFSASKIVPRRRVGVLGSLRASVRASVGRAGKIAVVVAALSVPSQAAKAQGDYLDSHIERREIRGVTRLNREEQQKSIAFRILSGVGLIASVGGVSYLLFRNRN